MNNAGTTTNVTNVFHVICQKVLINDPENPYKYSVYYFKIVHNNTYFIDASIFSDDIKDEVVTPGNIFEILNRERLHIDRSIPFKYFTVDWDSGKLESVEEELINNMRQL